MSITVKRALGDSVIEFSVNAPETQMPTPEEGIELFWPSVRTILDQISQRRNCFKFQVTFDGVFQVSDYLYSNSVNQKIHHITFLFLAPYLLKLQLLLSLLVEKRSRN